MTAQDALRLTDALQARFGGQAEAEEVGPGRYRFAIVTPAFANVPHMQRQDQAWEIVDRTLTRDQVVELSLLLTYSPEEVHLTADA